MKKYFGGALAVVLLSACAVPGGKSTADTAPATNADGSVEAAADAVSCLGNNGLPAEVADQFEAVDDPELLASVLGAPMAGMLCQGKVYQLKAGTEFTVYRAWNSSNPNSRLGKWWAFSSPAGKTAQYRSDYEICYQWSPLDKLVHCKLSAGVKVVVGTGQSAKCSEYLSYPASAAKQIYIDNAAEAVMNCQEYDGVFQWQAVQY
ncbi:hypothetical protein AB4876_07750 [Zhongshania guokunii]|uniref:Lipoprotein n=1 Tax=Zhongshania guokunii TaxID=641783 RepID=A0ABV3U5R6_9GAMM